MPNLTWVYLTFIAKEAHIEPDQKVFIEECQGSVSDPLIRKVFNAAHYSNINKSIEVDFTRTVVSIQIKSHKSICKCKICLLQPHFDCVIFDLDTIPLVCDIMKEGDAIQNTLA